MLVWCISRNTIVFFWDNWNCGWERLYEIYSGHKFNAIGVDIVHHGCIGAKHVFYALVAPFEDNVLP